MSFYLFLFRATIFLFTLIHTTTRDGFVSAFVSASSLTSTTASNNVLHFHRPSSTFTDLTYDRNSFNFDRHFSSHYLVKEKSMQSTDDFSMKKISPIVNNNVSNKRENVKQYAKLLTYRGGNGGGSEELVQSSTKTALNKLSKVQISPEMFSQFLGYIIISGSALFKIPQVVRIVQHKRSKGISLSMFALETVGMLLSLAFSIRSNFPISTYGETYFIVAQNLMILFCMSLYDEVPPMHRLIVAMAISSILFSLTLNASLTPMWLVKYLGALSIPLLNLARIPQLYLNWKNKSTGELAPSTLIIQCVGNIIRIFTTFVQVKNPLFMASTLIAFVFNGGLCLQTFIYGSGPPVTIADNKTK